MKAIGTLLIVGALLIVLWAIFAFQGALEKFKHPGREACSICQMTPYDVTFVRGGGSMRICDACAFRTLREGRGTWIVKIIVDDDTGVKSHARRR
jgi:hypothetical protein